MQDADRTDRQRDAGRAGRPARGRHTVVRQGLRQTHHHHGRRRAGRPGRDGRDPRSRSTQHPRRAHLCRHDSTRRRTRSGGRSTRGRPAAAREAPRAGGVADGRRDYEGRGRRAREGTGGDLAEHGRQRPGRCRPRGDRSRSGRRDGRDGRRRHGASSTSCASRIGATEGGLALHGCLYFLPSGARTPPATSPDRGLPAQ